MSLNMLIEFGDAFDYSSADFVSWCREAGFRERSDSGSGPFKRRGRL